MISITNDDGKHEFETADEAIEYLRECKKNLFKKEMPKICNKCIWGDTDYCPGDPSHCII